MSAPTWWTDALLDEFGTLIHSLFCYQKKQASLVKVNTFRFWFDSSSSWLLGVTVL